MGAGNRVKALRKALGMSQREFGQYLGIGDTAVSRIERCGMLTESNIKLLCKEFHVSEQWLRTGEGEMYVADPQADIMDFVGQLMHDNDDSFKQRLISALARLNEKEWCLLAKIANDMAKKEGDA